jgi:hypothetical protein
MRIFKKRKKKVVVDDPILDFYANLKKGGVQK